MGKDASQQAAVMDVERVLAALGHVRVPNTRCLARVAETPPQLRPPGPQNPPMWCCLPAGHDGQHRHNGGGMYPSIPFRDTDQVVMGDQLPDPCEKCRCAWPCPDAVAIQAAFAQQQGQGAAVEKVTARPCQEAAERAISNFLADELGQVPSFALTEDGEPSDGEKCGWAFWITEDNCSADTTSYVHADLSIEWYGTALERTAPPAQPAERVPEGWVMVPREPTVEMQIRGAYEVSFATREGARAMWKAMLAASPSAEVAHG